MRQIKDLHVKDMDLDRVINGLKLIRDRPTYKTWKEHYKGCWDGEENCDICYKEEILNLDWEVYRK